MKKMRNVCALCLFLFLLAPFAQAQDNSFTSEDSCGLRISLLTCSPGAELYSTFGHSALRVVDQSAGTDIVYNYGVFDFYDPQFYAKFVQGKLLYYLDQQAFPDFVQAYREENRSVREQVLALSCAEEKSMQEFLFNNIRPENRQYKYDFLFDNCTTRLRDLILGTSEVKYRTGDILNGKELSFRNHIHSYLNMNRMPWSKLGIDLLLGSRLDRKMTNQEAMFLPDFLEKALDSSRNERSGIVLEKLTIFQRDEAATPGKDFPLSPALLGWLLFTLICIASVTRGRAFHRFLAVTDFLIFFITGLLGLLLVYMWVGTDHQICKDNLNLIWAFPLHAAAAFFVRSSSVSWKKYFHSIAVIDLLLLISWAILPQELNPALIPFISIIALRAWFIAGRKKSFIWKNTFPSAA